MLAFLVLGMMATGCLNTLLLKYQDTTCHALEGTCSSFPVIQSIAMFLGEMGCLLVHRAQYVELSERPELLGTKVLWLAIPAVCDILGTTIMSIGLLTVPASVFQMCRGSLVIWVGLFSVVFLRRRLSLVQWIALCLITLGVALVGLASVKSADVDAHATMLGVCLIIGAQVFTASQFCVEEWILGQYAIEPLKVAGYEGSFGTGITMTTAGILYASGLRGTFDVAAGLDTIMSSMRLQLAFVSFAVSIAAFNFFGLSVTRTLSATARSTIDTCRTLIIWLVSMVLGWETFKVLQLLGFSMLVYATLVFNGVINAPFQKPERVTEVEVERTGLHTTDE